MRISVQVLAFGLMAFALAPVSAQSRAAVESDISRFSGEPALSAASEKMADIGYADRSRVNAAKAGSRSIIFSEEGPNDTSVSISMDPISGKIAVPKSH